MATETGVIGFQHGDGEVLTAASAEQAIAMCPELGRIALESPEEAEALIALSAMTFEEIEEEPAQETESRTADEMAQAKPELTELIEAAVAAVPADTTKTSDVITESQKPVPEIISDGFAAAANAENTAADIVEQPEPALIAHFQESIIQPAEDGPDDVHAEVLKIETETADTGKPIKATDSPVHAVKPERSGTESNKRTELPVSERPPQKQVAEKRIDDIAELVLAPAVDTEPVFKAAETMPHQVEHEVDRGEVEIHISAQVTHPDSIELPAQDLIDIQVPQARNLDLVADMEAPVIHFSDETEEAGPDTAVEAIDMDDIDRLIAEINAAASEYPVSDEELTLPVEIPETEDVTIVDAGEEILELVPMEIDEPDIQLQPEYATAELAEEMEDSKAIENVPPEFEQLLIAPPGREGAVTMEAMQNDIETKPMLEIVSEVVRCIAESEGETIDTELLAAISDVHESIRSRAAEQNEDKLPKITPDLTEKLIAFFNILGYGKPHQALIEFVTEYGADYLLEVFEYMYKLTNDEYRKEFLSDATFSLASISNGDDSFRARIGKELFSLMNKFSFEFSV